MQRLRIDVRGGREFGVKTPLHIETQEGEVEELHRLICEGRRDEAICLLNSMFDFGDATYLRSVAEQRNLFPDRVPA